MDVALDPRWGRVHETYGEDPYLAPRSAWRTRAAFRVTICARVYRHRKALRRLRPAQGGINLSAYEGGPRRTRDLFAYPFEAAIQLAGLHRS